MTMDCTFTYIGAMFSVPSLEILSESDSSLTICIVMTTIPQLSTLAKEVEVHLFTEDGTGT